jgi:hypothetical protein
MNENIKISAVIELNASEFTEKEYKYPDGSRYEFPTGWELYWKNSLKDSGLIKVEQIFPGFPFVEITRIEEDELKIIVETQLKDTNLENEDEIISFEGGIVIQVDNDRIVPQCCTSISDYKGLLDIINKKPSEWTQIWIGHPWIFARIKDDLIEFSDYCELNEYNGLAKTTINFEAFKNEFEKVLTEIEGFKKSVENILNGKNLEKYERISEILIENNAE